MDLDGLLQQMSMPLQTKIEMTKNRIRAWMARWHGNVYVAFSGGKDSTVLLHIARQVNPNILGVFSDTGLEYPEIREFVKSYDNIETIRPCKSFLQVVKEEGYPVISKEQAKYIREYRTTHSDRLRHKRLYGAANKRRSGKISDKWQYLINAPFQISERCCQRLKKDPFHIFEKTSELHPIIGIMAGDSAQRKQHASKHGCVVNKPGAETLRPMIFWKEQDVWDYLKKHNVPYCNLYDRGVHRTGCIFCGFGAHLEKRPNRFELLAKSHPQLWRYCMDKIGMKAVLDYCHIPTGNQD
jgi:3'-phosphoadenosine 5'-phosphosulfate sulfotransferase (PAPS reductase)/FAD synthetase